MVGRNPRPDELADDLAQSGELGRSTAAFLREHKIRVVFRDQPTGARWTLGRTIQVNPRYAAAATFVPYLLSLIVHEVQHIKQGPHTALSVFGELEAWQMQFRFLAGITAGMDDIPGNKQAVRGLLSLPLGWDRNALQEARQLMSAYAGPRYRIGILPLYPLWKEIRYRLLGIAAAALPPQGGG